MACVVGLAVIVTVISALLHKHKMKKARANAQASGTPMESSSRNEATYAVPYAQPVGYGAAPQASSDHAKALEANCPPPTYSDVQASKS